MSLLELFCHIDDFCQNYESLWQQSLLESGQPHRQRRGQMSMSEMMTLVVHVHQQRYRDFKTYYTQYFTKQLQCEFPTLLSYNRFIWCSRRHQVLRGGRWWQ